MKGGEKIDMWWLIDLLPNTLNNSIKTHILKSIDIIGREKEDMRWLLTA